jgi:predicted peptidase
LAVQALQRQFPIDGKRLYLIGISMGGHGVWDLAARFPAFFAALVPICAAANPTQAAVLAPIPSWSFHGAEDREVPVDYTRKFIEALRQAGGQPKYSEFPKVGHSCTSHVFQTADLLPWLFAQSLQQ